MALCCTVTSIPVLFVPETHGPTLLKRKLAREGRALPALKAREVASIYGAALARPFVYLFTGENFPLFSQVVRKSRVDNGSTHA